MIALVVEFFNAKQRRCVALKFFVASGNRVTARGTILALREQVAPPRRAVEVRIVRRVLELHLVAVFDQVFTREGDDLQVVIIAVGHLARVNAAIVAVTVRDDADVLAAALQPPVPFAERLDDDDVLVPNFFIPPRFRDVNDKVVVW